jgi:linoleate 10R-lipoxygenase
MSSDTFALFQPADFPNSEKVKTDRLPTSYDLTPMLRHKNGTDLAVAFAAEVLREVFKLKNVRRATGNAGRLAKFTTVINKTDTDVYITPTGKTSPFPGSMQIMVSIDQFYRSNHVVISAFLQYDL